MSDPIVEGVARVLAERELRDWLLEYHPGEAVYLRHVEDATRELASPSGPLAPLLNELERLRAIETKAREYMIARSRCDRAQTACALASVATRTNRVKAAAALRAMSLAGDAEREALAVMRAMLGARDG